MSRSVARPLRPLRWVPALAVGVSLVPTVAVGLSAAASQTVVRGFFPPTTRYGAGHLGVDLAAPPGAPVRALRPGVVAFAGRVGPSRHVVVRLDDGRRVTYGYLASVRAAVGTRVGRGATLGTAGGRGPRHGGTVWHLGLRVGSRYVDPSALLRSGPPTIGLAPLALVRSDFRPRSAPVGPSGVAATLRPDARVEPGRRTVHTHTHAREPEVAPTVPTDRRSRGRKSRTEGGAAVAVVTMKQLLEAGVHFGHQTRRWNPKMRRFIFGERNGIYIVDLHQTLDRIDTAYRFVRDNVADGGTVLFVGTKRQAQEPIEQSARSCGMPYVNFRWLGGMLTNFQTVHARVAKLRELQRQVDSGEVDQMPKKEGLKVRRDLAKLERNLGGIKNLEKAPTVVFVIDTKKEHIAVTEANRLRIPVVAVVDTNCDPDVINYVIPGNDDAIRSANLMCRVVADAVNEGREIARRRGARAGTRSESVVEEAAKPQRSAEEEAEHQRRQAEARAQAAAAQKEREARLLEQKAEQKRAAAETGESAPAASDAAGDEATEGSDG